jgi:hypothetical protein
VFGINSQPAHEQSPVTTHQRRRLHTLCPRALVAGALLWSVTSSLAVYPHSLSYFNELAGGPRNGWKHLNFSNIDWGQDLLFLQEWLEEHPEARPLHLLYHGNFDPHVAGIDYQSPSAAPHGYVPPRARERRPAMESQASVSRLASRTGAANSVGPIPGWHAVSVHMLSGSPSQFWAADGQPRFAALYDYAWYQEFEPLAMAGYSIYIYHITLDEANRVRRKLRLEELVNR